ncbi:hypothetical protein JXA32_08660 [Candidatus Sumerlaeota bacterium]|nr:hypothetical protein [Candidatus Sumerlaeota bacterium]
MSIFRRKKRLQSEFSALQAKRARPHHWTGRGMMIPVFFALLAMHALEPPQPPQWLLVVRMALLALLTSGLLMRKLAHRSLLQPRFMTLDALLIFWICWEAVCATQARVGSAALEGLRNVVLAAVAYAWAAHAFHYGRLVTLRWMTVVGISIALAGMLWRAPQMHPSEALIWAALTPFGLITLRSDRLLGHFSQTTVKWSCLALAAAFIAGYFGLEHRFSDPVNPTERIALQWQFERAELAESLFWRHWLTGVGRGNFDWRWRALTGQPAAARIADRDPWPYLAESGAVSLVVLLLIAYQALFFQQLAPSPLRQVTSPVNKALRGLLFLWLICGFAHGALWRPAGVMMTFFLIGALRGWKAHWLDRSASGAFDPDADSRIGAVADAPPKLQPALGLAPRVALTIALAFFLGAVLTLPEAARAWSRNGVAASPQTRIRRAMQAILLYPRDGELWLRAAQARIATMNLDGESAPTGPDVSRVTEALYRARECNPLDAEIHFALADWQQRALQRPASAIASLQRGCEECPGDWKLASTLSERNAAEDRPDEALEGLKPFLQRRPGDMELLRRAMQLAQAAGNPAFASRIQRRTQILLESQGTGQQEIK